MLNFSEVFLVVRKLGAVERPYVTQSWQRRKFSPPSAFQYELPTKWSAGQEYGVTEMFRVLAK